MAAATQPTERAEAAVAEQPGAVPNFAQDERDLDSFGLEGVEEARRRCEAFRKIFARLRAEVGKSLVGQREVVDLALVTALPRHHNSCSPRAAHSPARFAGDSIPS
jgi:hypothetical protein